MLQLLRQLGMLPDQHLKVEALNALLNKQDDIRMQESCSKLMFGPLTSHDPQG